MAYKQKVSNNKLNKKTHWIYLSCKLKLIKILSQIKERIQTVFSKLSSVMSNRWSRISWLSNPASESDRISTGNNNDADSVSNRSPEVDSNLLRTLTEVIHDAVQHAIEPLREEIAALRAMVRLFFLNILYSIYLFMPSPLRLIYFLFVRTNII